MEERTYKTRVYLAVPYTAKSDHLRDERFLFVTKLAARFIAAGFNCFSPITHSHLIAKHGGKCLNGLWTTWLDIDLDELDHSDVMYVACIPGWRESTGVQEEINYALSIGLTVVLLSARTAALFMNGDINIFI